MPGGVCVCVCVRAHPGVWVLWAVVPSGGWVEVPGVKVEVFCWGL